VSQKDLIPVIKTLNEIISLSGVSSAQAARGMLQLSEGLGAGALQGQHLKSLLNDIPTLGLELSKGLGVSIAGLREMASKGELTAKTVIEAFQKVAPEVQKQFGSLAPTISQAFTVLKNSMLQFVGVFDQLNGTSRVVSGAIIFLANNLSTFVRILETAIVTVAAFYAGLAIQTGLAAFSAGLAAAIVRLDAYMLAAAEAGVETTILGRAMVAFQTPLALLTGGFSALWAVIAANPITALITVIGAAIGLIYAFGDAIFLTSDKSISLLGAMVGTWNYLWGLLKSFVSWMYSYLAPVFNFIGTLAVTVFKAIGDVIGGVLDYLGKFIPSLAGASAGLASLTSGLVQSMKDATKSTAEATLANKDFSDVTAKDLESVGNDAKKMAAVAVPEYKKMAEAAKGAGKAATDMSLETRDALGNVQKYLNETDLQSGRLYNNIQKGAEDTTASLDKMSAAVTSAAQAQATANGSTALGSGGQSTNPMLEGGTSTDGGQTFHSAVDDIKEFKNYGHPIGNPVSLGTAVPWLQLLDEVGNDAVLKAAVTAAAHGRGIPGFAGGGEFMVGGSGGTDSQLVSFMASPDETVSIQTPKQRSARGGGAGKNVTINMNVSTPDANSFRRSQNQTFLQLQSKLNTAVNRW
jgi:tape measure domain-containing protein